MRSDAISYCLYNFNSRSLCGERSIADASWFSKVVFQFLLPAWGAISRNSYCRCSSWFQFSLLSWGAIWLISLIFSNIGISILAPCLGSDKAAGISSASITISILAPAWGAIFLNVFRSTLRTNFNSRSLCGSDVINYTFSKICFNSRPLRGERYTMMITDSLS